jgi:TIR domain
MAKSATLEGVMAFVPGFDYDLFISYAHTDNSTATPKKAGWVKQFHDKLTIQLAQLVGGSVGMVRIWWDERLDGSQVFNEVIQNRINQSALFLALTSPTYLQSDYCLKELRWFRQKARGEKVGLQIGERMRIVNVLLYNIPYDKWPEEFPGRTGFPFHDAQGKQGKGIGRPLDPQEKRFEGSLRGLVDAVRLMLVSFKELTGEPVTSPTLVASQPLDEAPDVYMAEVADTLRQKRARVISELSRKGIKVYKKTIPPPHETREHEQAVVNVMKRATLSVHLLDEFEGAKIEGKEEAEATYLQEQVKLGLKNARSQIICVRPDLEAINVEDELQKNLLDKLENGNRGEGGPEFIRASMPTEIVQVIIDKIEQLKKPVPAARVPLAALLDTHRKDQLFALEMSRFLLEKNIQPYVNPEEDDPACNIKIFKERLKQVGALIIFYGLVNEEWVRARLAEAIKIVISENCPVKTFWIYLAPPEEGKTDVRFNPHIFKQLNLLDNRRGFNPASLSPLLVSLGAGAG